MRTKRNVILSKFVETFASLFSRFIYVFYRASPRFSNLANYLILVALAQKKLVDLEETSTFKSVRFEGRWINSVEIQPSNEKELVKEVMSSYKAARRMQSNIAEPYQPRGELRELFNNRWRYFFESLSREDYEAVAGFLRNFFRNEGISGLWTSDTNPFQVFCNLDKLAQLQSAHQMVEQYLVWRNNLPSIDLKELDAPRVGNPWGYHFGDYLLYQPVFEYNFHAHYFSNLLDDIQEPVVIEIGGGFGGLAYHLLRSRPSIKYIGFDLPEMVLIQTYYLSCIFPDARILTYQEDSRPLTLDQLNSYDIVLLPNFEMKRTDSLIADLIVNVRSLSEMSYPTIAEYFSQIDRLGRSFFYHENIFKARTDELFGIPSSNFPSLKNFKQISANESRWPRYNKDSAYPCQENLFIRRQTSR